MRRDVHACAYNKRTKEQKETGGERGMRMCRVQLLYILEYYRWQKMKCDA